jgi:DNA-binding protein HU-beta
MTQVELIAKITEEINRELSKGSSDRVFSKSAAGRLVDFIGRMIVTDLLLDGRSSFPGLGIFSVVERAARACINPKTGKSIGVKPAYKAVKFKTSRELKEKVANN